MLDGDLSRAVDGRWLPSAIGPLEQLIQAAITARAYQLIRFWDSPVKALNRVRPIKLSE